MDLFTLVAKLTLDSKEYEKALRGAERDSRNTSIETSGTISLKDNYSSAVERIKAEASDTNLDVSGEASLDTSDYKEIAERTPGEVNMDVSGDAELQTDNYESEAATAAAEIDLDADGEANLYTDTYEQDAAEAAESAESELDIAGDADLDTTGYLTDAETAAADATESLNITATVTLDTSSFNTEVESAKEKGNELSGLFSGLKVGGIVAGVGAVASWIGGTMEQTAAYADTVDKASQKFGISTKAFQEWDHALSQSGADVMTLQRGLMNMNQAITGGGTDEMMAAFALAGVDPTQYENNIEGLMRDTIMGLAGMESGTDRDNALTAIFGRSGTDLNALLNSGVTGIESLVQEANALGLIMSDEDIQAGVAYGDAMANIKSSTSAIMRDLSSVLIPAVNQILQYVLSLVEHFRREERIAEIQAELTAAYSRTDRAAEYLASEEGQAALAAIREENTETARERYQFDTSSVAAFLSSIESYGGTYSSVRKQDTFGKVHDTYVVNIDGVTMELDTSMPLFDLNQFAEAMLNKLFTSTNMGGYTLTAAPHAKGLFDVPYDDYLASLHRDEMVLTASQAREYKKHGSGSEDVAAAISELRNDIANIKLVVGEKVFGQTVVDYSGRRMKGYLGKAEDRAYAGYGWG